MATKCNIQIAVSDDAEQLAVFFKYIQFIKTIYTDKPKNVLALQSFYFIFPE